MSNSSILAPLVAFSSRSNVEPIDPSQAKLWVSEKTLGQYFQVATVSILAYDIIITMDKEIKYFWIPRKPVDFVYFANRYIGLFGAVAILFWNSFSANIALCNFSIWATNLANLITVILIDYILMVRVLALFAQARMVSAVLKMLLIFEAIFGLALFIYLAIAQHVVLGGLDSFTFCGHDAFPPWQVGLVDWIIPLVYGIILLSLELYKAAEYWKLSAGLKGFTLVNVLIQDQVIYFSLVVICCVMNIITFKLDIPNAFLANVMSALGNPSFLCVLGSRMLFNLKEAGERGQNEGTSYRLTLRTVSEMDFA